MTTLGGQSLMRHIYNGDLTAVLQLLDSASISLDERDENGQTFLMVASQLGHIEVVRELLSNDVDVNAVDNDNWTALLNAAKEGHNDVIHLLLEKGSFVEHRDLGGWTALMWACYKGRTEVVKDLLELGANPNSKGMHHMSSLTWAAGRGHTEIVNDLLLHGAKASVADKYGTTPLVWAARRGHLEIVEALLNQGVNVDAAGMNSWTALLVAARGGYSEVVEALLQYNPNVNAVDQDGYTALSIAAKDGHLDIVQQLLHKDAYVNLPDRNGDTILIHAVKGCHIEIVRLLLNKFADVDVQGMDTKTALYWSAEKNNADIARVLVDYNPDTEVSTTDGDTALLKAVRNRNTELVELLIGKGGKVSATDKKGDSVLHIALRARSKKLTEILLRNPKDSRLLYRPNKAGETPYNIDVAHQKSILTQIFGARHLNASEANEDMLGYDLYSSTIADVLSEPTLCTPITVGLYAKWGSGKSFLLDKLQREMKSFADQQPLPVFEFSWLVFYFSLSLALLIGVILGLATRWEVGVGMGCAVLALQYGFFVLIWYACDRRDWEWAYNISVYLAEKIDSLRLLLQILFCNQARRRTNKNHIPSVKFLFTDYTRLTSVGGEKSIALMVATLCEALEAEHGKLITRLYRSFKPEKGAIGMGHFKSLCCIPYFLIVIFIIICIVVGTILLVIYGVTNIQQEKNTPVFVTLVTITVIVGIAIVGNLYTWGKMMLSLVRSTRKRIMKAADQLVLKKMEGFMQTLKSEVELLTRMTQHLDSFTGNLTRLVVIVDGLDSCEQEKLLQVLDTVHMLFSDADSPFITVLAVDPHVIIRGIEQNLHTLFHDSSINGHDYLRNMVHLPFFLQSQGLPNPRDMTRTRTTSRSFYSSNQEMGGSPRFQKTYVFNACGTQVTAVDEKRGESVSGESGRRKSVKARKQSQFGSGLLSRQASIYGSGLLTRTGSVVDLSKILMKNDYFSDINPRSMRRLMNIVAVTGRLLRAYNIDYSWHRLAAWINVTEQWPYRTSWTIMYLEENEEIDSSSTLKSVYDKVKEKIPTSKEVDPLAEIDRNSRKLEMILGNTPVLTIGDLRKFLPCSISLDPYLRKLIKEQKQQLGEQPEFSLFNHIEPGHPPMPPPAAPWVYPGMGGRSSASPGPRATPTKPSGPRVHNMPPFAQSPLVPHPNPYMAAAAATPHMAYLWHSMQQQAQQPVPPRARAPKVNLQGGITKKLSTMSVTEVCTVLGKVEGLNSTMLESYQEKIAELNINGFVLSSCEIDELKDVMTMNFGDWQLFKSIVLHLREVELNGVEGNGVDGANGAQFPYAESSEPQSPRIKFTSDPKKNNGKNNIVAPIPMEPKKSSMKPTAVERSDSVDDVKRSELVPIVEGTPLEFNQLGTEEQAKYKQALREYIKQGGNGAGGGPSAIGASPDKPSSGAGSTQGGTPDLARKDSILGEILMENAMLYDVVDADFEEEDEEEETDTELEDEAFDECNSRSGSFALAPIIRIPNRDGSQPPEPNSLASSVSTVQSVEGGSGGLSCSPSKRTPSLASSSRSVTFCVDEDDVEIGDSSSKNYYKYDRPRVLRLDKEPGSPPKKKESDKNISPAGSSPKAQPTSTSSMSDETEDTSEASVRAPLLGSGENEMRIDAGKKAVNQRFTVVPAESYTAKGDTNTSSPLQAIRSKCTDILSGTSTEDTAPLMQSPPDPNQPASAAEITKQVSPSPSLSAFRLVSKGSSASLVSQQSATTGSKENLAALDPPSLAESFEHYVKDTISKKSGASRPLLVSTKRKDERNRQEGIPIRVGASPSPDGATGGDDVRIDIEEGQQNKSMDMNV